MYRNKRVPDLEDLLKQVELDELADRAANTPSVEDLEAGDGDRDGQGDESEDEVGAGMGDSLMDELLAEEAAREAAEDAQD